MCNLWLGPASLDQSNVCILLRLKSANVDLRRNRKLEESRGIQEIDSDHKVSLRDQKKQYFLRFTWPESSWDRSWVTGTDQYHWWTGMQQSSAKYQQAKYKNESFASYITPRLGWLEEWCWANGISVLLKLKLWGAWVAQSVEAPTLAQVMISLSVSLRATSGPLLSACQHRTRFGSFVPFSLHLPCLCSPPKK